MWLTIQNKAYVISLDNFHDSRWARPLTYVVIYVEKGCVKSIFGIRSVCRMLPFMERLAGAEKPQLVRVWQRLVLVT